MRAASSDFDGVASSREGMSPAASIDDMGFDEDGDAIPNLVDDVDANDIEADHSEADDKHLLSMPLQNIQTDTHLVLQLSVFASASRQYTLSSMLVPRLSTMARHSTTSILAYNAAIGVVKVHRPRMSAPQVLSADILKPAGVKMSSRRHARQRI